MLKPEIEMLISVYKLHIGHVTLVAHRRALMPRAGHLTQLPRTHYHFCHSILSHLRVESGASWVGWMDESQFRSRPKSSFSVIALQGV